MILNVFGSTERGGRHWDARVASPVITLFGSTELDLRYAELGEGETEIVVVSAFGSVDITVPDDLPVLVAGMSLLGNRTALGESSSGIAHGTDTASPDFHGAPGRRLRLSIFAALGDANVRRATAIGMTV
jgi:predicted membrane protein